MNAAALLLLFTQAVPADVSIDATIEARSVEVKSAGRTQAEVRVAPEQSKQVTVERSAPAGQSQYRDLKIRLQIEGRIADPLQSAGVANGSTNENSTRNTGEPQ